MPGYKKIVITFGRYNPPTIGHQLVFDTVLREAGRDDHRIFTGHTQDSKKNPLNFNQKIKWLKKMFPRLNISSDPTILNIFNALAKLVDEGYNYVVLVTGSDRIAEFERVILPYINNPDPEKRLNLVKFESVSAGDRDPDSDDVSGMSSSKMREFARQNSFEQFLSGLPKSLSERDALDLFKEVQTGLVVEHKKIGTPKVDSEKRTGNKNLHLEHLEDQIINFGIDGGKQAINFLESLEKMLAGSSSTKLNVTVKWDGSPSIVCGINPENKKFFVGTKSVFAAQPKINYTEQDILENHGYGSGLSAKLKAALRYLPELGIKGVIQGDVMFSGNDVKTQNIEGQNYLTFKPNTILYAVAENSELAKTIKSAKFGVVFHTVYSGSKLSQMSASFNFNINQLRKSSNVWASDAYFKNQSGEATFSSSETAIFRNMISDCKVTLSNVNAEVLRIVTGTVTHAEFFMRFINSKIRTGQSISSPGNLARDFVGYYDTKMDEEMNKLATLAGKEKKRISKEEMIHYLTVNKTGLESIFTFMVNVTEAKLFVIKKLEKVKSIGTFIQTESGFKVTAPEGYVAVDTTTNHAVKLVDRLTFSQANFNATKDWVKGN